MIHPSHLTTETKKAACFCSSSSFTHIDWWFFFILQDINGTLLKEVSPISWIFYHSFNVHIYYLSHAVQVGIQGTWVCVKIWAFWHSSRLGAKLATTNSSVPIICTISWSLSTPIPWIIFTTKVKTINYRKWWQHVNILKFDSASNSSTQEML